MKKCPFCAEQIQDDAIKCRYCGSMLAGTITGGESLPSDPVEEEVRLLALGHRKIEAIKLVREKRGLGLKEAKEYVEALEKGNEPPHLVGAAGATQKGSGAAQKGCLGCLGVVGLLVAFSWLFGSSGGTGSTSTDHTAAAIVHCQNFVRDRLRSPSTADFPFLDRQVTSPGNNAYVVASYVDAQNAFGAMIRNDFRCTIRYKGGEEAASASWELVDLQLNAR